MIAQHGLTLHFTPAYDQAAAHLMLNEANRLAQILGCRTKLGLNRAFALIELLIVIAMIAILAIVRESAFICAICG